LVSDNFAQQENYSPSKLKKLKPKYIDPSKILDLSANQEHIEGVITNNLVTSLVAQEDQRVNKQAMGFDVLRLSSPPIDTMNEDFLCGKCQKIVN
jgi:hypothetical protein